MGEISHHCHAVGCPKEVRPELLMCGVHWRMVPVNLQRDVWRHYRDGQCDDKQPSYKWCVAADAAVLAVAQKTGRAVRLTFVEAFHPKCPDCGGSPEVPGPSDFVDDGDAPLCKSRYHPINQ
jgi:hypothetical protein